jgi:hypothetical protein
VWFLSLWYMQGQQESLELYCRLPEALDVFTVVHQVMAQKDRDNERWWVQVLGNQILLSLLRSHTGEHPLP